jgi:hypothetical protein
MKIELKILPAHVLALATSLDFLPKMQGLTRSQMILRSVMDNTMIKIHKKRIDIQNQSNLFNQKKKIKVTLELFEGHYLEIFVGMVLENPSFFLLNEYDRNALLSIVNELNQKLA